MVFVVTLKRSFEAFEGDRSGEDLAVKPAQSKITPATRSLRSRLKRVRGCIFINFGGLIAAIRTLFVRGCPMGALRFGDG